MFKSQYTDVPVEIWTRLEGRFLEASLGDLTTMLVPVYQKYLTESDLDEIINFYQTPVGKKYAMNTPMIMQESMQIGQEWGMKIGEELAKELAEQGY